MAIWTLTLRMPVALLDHCSSLPGSTPLSSSLLDLAHLSSINLSSRPNPLSLSLSPYEVSAFFSLPLLLLFRICFTCLFSSARHLSSYFLFGLCCWDSAYNGYVGSLCCAFALVLWECYRIEILLDTAHYYSFTDSSAKFCISFLITRRPFYLGTFFASFLFAPALLRYIWDLQSLLIFVPLHNCAKRYSFLLTSWLSNS